MTDNLSLCIEKMRSENFGDVAIAQFERMYNVWQTDETGWMREEDISPLTHSDVPSVADIYDSMPSDTAHDALAKTAIIKLNGGLGTSMGLEGPKSLLPVRRHKARQMRFLDIILGQVISTRSLHKIQLPLVLMNSFRTSKESLNVVRHNRRFHQDDIPLEIVQHQQPKIVAHTGRPVSFSKNHELEWCPPGHGDIYSTLWESGILDALQEHGIEYIFISNSDNLGARPSSTIAGHFARSQSDFMVEVSKKTAADRKGGHFVIDNETGHLTLREMSQVHPEDKSRAMNESVHPYFNTNNIWIRISALQKVLKKYNGILPLPVIRNNKTVDPTDPSSTRVVQLETAMGAAISLFDNATCIEVNRSRFLPVKTTEDLFILRSDRFHLTDAYEMEDGNYIFPSISLDPRYYKNIYDFNERFPYGVPSLAAAASVTIEGDWTFGQNTHCFGAAHLKDPGQPSYVPNGEYIGQQGIEPSQWHF
ncbi:UTP--glucose-1-phosphate uridylyltransferase [Alloscardovia macacae]|uniref:UTP--glucose-1-phosphate uridylyltransferase n=1 Tax=Alloscardovia macacae TaxID=1160091 RepID=A0A1Y2SSJ8_9BIFI|nr:UTP--glucose-1-phosphate uridylyltransferase [Alloscardovia macacae]OTA25679.1 UTP--glucose-1-phosphate uridylyltransferase [Alloscardovia macacae]OTA29606.1 UTP--glucose-1-phosphate uridylyltransferase [Alloscardovia macacae]OZG54910.1 UTP--glucose-1-phosphate uridylyltransferase [Alloscardovia macacae]